MAFLTTTLFSAISLTAPTGAIIRKRRRIFSTLSFVLCRWLFPVITGSEKRCKFCRFLSENAYFFILPVGCYFSDILMKNIDFQSFYKDLKI